MREMEKKRARGKVAAMDTSEHPPEVRERRSHVDAPHLACVSGENVAEERAQWRNSRNGDKRSEVEASP